MHALLARPLQGMLAAAKRHHHRRGAPRLITTRTSRTDGSAAKRALPHCEPAVQRAQAQGARREPCCWLAATAAASNAKAASGRAAAGSRYRPMLSDRKAALLATATAAAVPL